METMPIAANTSLECKTEWKAKQRKPEFHQFSNRIQLEFNERRKQLPKILQLSFRLEDLDQISIFVPPLNEQRLIFEKLQSVISPTIEIERKEQTRISLLEEYRKSLISSSVTGKFRVRRDMI